MAGHEALQVHYNWSISCEIFQLDQESVTSRAAFNLHYLVYIGNIYMGT